MGEQTDSKSNIVKDASIEKQDDNIKLLETVDSVDMPELEVVQEPQTTFQDYPEELIKDVIQVDKSIKKVPQESDNEQKYLVEVPITPIEEPRTEMLPKKEVS